MSSPLDIAATELFRYFANCATISENARLSEVCFEAFALCALGL
jgi:hypothetical protein